MATKPAPSVRHSAEERRESILDAAIVEFAAKGLHGTSTEDVAKRAGISQPYVFRLFGTKKKLFAEACRRCMRDVRDGMASAAAGKAGQEALDAMGAAYVELVRFLEQASGEPQQRVTRFFARGMLINVIAAMGVRYAGIDWADQLIKGCKDE